MEQTALIMNNTLSRLAADPGGYFGLGSYGDVPTFRVDFLTQKYFRQGANLGFN